MSQVSFAETSNKMLNENRRRLLCCLFFACTIAEIDRILRFRRDGTFKIAQFADLHYGEGEGEPWGPEQDVNSTRVMRNVLRLEKPDLVVFSGDQITGNNIENDAKKYWNEVVQPCVEGNFRWAILFGNHDDEANGTDGSRSDLMKFDQTFPLSLSQFGPSTIHGVSNYFLPVFPFEADPSTPPSLILYFFDSGGGSLRSIVHNDQVEWYKNMSTSMKEKYGFTIPAMAFFHIPSEDYSNIFSKEKCFGTKEEGVSPHDSDFGLFEAFVSMGDKLIEDHGNDWCCPTKANIALCFGRHSGYGGYGKWDRGSRIIQATRAADRLYSKTWVRMEHGDTRSEGSLP